MQKIKKWVALAAFALLALAAMPGIGLEAPQKKTVNFYAYYELVLASDGSIEELVPMGKKLGSPIAEFLEKSIRSWKFEAGKIDGVPQRTESLLWLNVDAQPREDGSYDMEIVEARTGAFGAVERLPPVYPEQQLMLGHEAVLRMVVNYDENGVVTKVARVAKLGAREERSMKPFELASVTALKKWRFKPEKFGGRGIPGTIIVPMQFCMEDTKCSAFLTGTKEKEKLARQITSRALEGSSVISIQRPGQLN